MTSSRVVHESVYQHNETDFDFIQRLGRRIGFEFIVDANTAIFAPPSANGDTVELSYPEDLRAFRPRITAVQQVEKVNVRGFDFKAKKAVLATEAAPQQVTRAGITRQQVASKFPGADARDRRAVASTSSGEAAAMAKATLDQLANAYLGAEGSCAGNPKIKAGALLKITGVGRNYSGTYRVAKATHVIRGGSGYVTSFANSAGEHTLLGQSSATASGPVRARLDHGRHRHQQQGPREARPREGEAAGDERRGVVLGAGPGPRGQQGARHLDAADARRRGDRRVRERRPVLPLRHRLRCSTARTPRAARWRSTTARSR